MQDRNFDHLTDKLAHNIYGTAKGIIREAILWDELKKIIVKLADKPLTILDAGGGEGRIASALAEMGHQVTLCDISSKMIERAMILARNKGVIDRMHFKQINARLIGAYLDKPVDLILFHAVLEWITEPLTVLQQLYQVLIPGGALSLMFYNRHGLIFRNLTLGNFDWIRAGMRKRKNRSLSPDYPRDIDEVINWLQVCGFTIGPPTGIRIFKDYMAKTTKSEQDIADVLEMERRFSHVEPYLRLARYIHITAYKPVGVDYAT